MRSSAARGCVASATVAQKALVGEGADAWRLMLQNYDRNSDWILTDCTVPIPHGAACPEADQSPIDFPTALKKHLETEGYDIAGLTQPAPPPPPATPRPRPIRGQSIEATSV